MGFSDILRKILESDGPSRYEIFGKISVLYITYLVMVLHLIVMVMVIFHGKVWIVMVFTVYHWCLCFGLRKILAYLVWSSKGGRPVYRYSKYYAIVRHHFSLYSLFLRSASQKKTI